MDTPRVLIHAHRLRRRVRQLGRELSHDLAGQRPLFVPLLDGCFCFVADLVRAIHHPDLRLHFARSSSYHGGTQSSGEPVLADIPDCTGRSVVLVDDILDTGNTLSRMSAALRAAGAERLLTCVLLDKPARRQVPIEADYVGFTVPDLFVVGYGLDHGDRHRHLPHVCSLAAPDADSPA